MAATSPSQPFRFSRSTKSLAAHTTRFCTSFAPGWDFSRGFVHSTDAPEPDYETILSALESRIKQREAHLLSIRLRERRANALFITYGLGAWFVYLAVWWFVLAGKQHGAEKAVGGLPVVAGPVIIIFTRRFLRWWYHRKQDKEETTLRQLKKEQREKVEELKRKTGYYSTRNLLEKYDEVVKKNAEARGGPNGRPGAAGASKPAPNAPQTPVKGAAVFPAGTPVRPGQIAPPGTPQANLPLLPPAPSTPQPRTIMDKVADALLGVTADDTPNSKYALICGKCFAHNGLVVKEEFDTIQYQCPRCGFFNPRRTNPSSSSTLGAQPTHRRRVQSMHVTGSGSLDDGVGGSASGSKDGSKDGTPQEKDEDDEQAEEKLLVDQPAKGEAVRRRGAGARSKKSDDDMDTDP